MKKKTSLLQDIQELKGKEIAKAFFYTFTTPKNVSDMLYPRHIKIRKKKNAKQFIMPAVQNRFKLWKENGFIEISRKVSSKKKNRWGTFSKCKTQFYLMNFEPVFAFCKERGFEFTPEEKKFILIDFSFKHEEIRKAILKEYPKEDIITATLKFYVKNLIMRYSLYLRDIYENSKKYKSLEKKREEMINPTAPFGIMIKKQSDLLNKKISKRYKLPYKKDEHKLMGIIAMKEWQKDYAPKSHLFWEYINEIDENKQLVLSIDNKILGALNLL